MITLKIDLNDLSEDGPIGNGESLVIWHFGLIRQSVESEIVIVNVTPDKLLDLLKDAIARKADIIIQFDDLSITTG